MGSRILAFLSSPDPALRLPDSLEATESNMRTAIIILLLVGSLAWVFYLLAAQERSGTTCYWQGEREEDQEDAQSLHLNECYK